MHLVGENKPRKRVLYWNERNKNGSLKKFVDYCTLLEISCMNKIEHYIRLSRWIRILQKIFLEIFLEFAHV